MTFFISGLLVASIPVVAQKFNNQIAGFLILVPMVLTLGLVVQYISNGDKAAAEMLRATLIGLPTLDIFIVVALMLLHNYKSTSNRNLSLVGWFTSAYLISMLMAKWGSRAAPTS